MYFTVNSHMLGGPGNPKINGDPGNPPPKNLYPCLEMPSLRNYDFALVYFAEARVRSAWMRIVVGHVYIWRWLLLNLPAGAPLRTASQRNHRFRNFIFGRGAAKTQLRNQKHCNLKNGLCVSSPELLHRIQNPQSRRQKIRPIQQATPFSHFSYKGYV